jgi:uncharacterized protein (TIGR03086 family)
MTASSEQLFDQGLDFFGDVVGRVTPEQWEQPSSCEGWRNLDVLGHLGTSVSMGNSLLRGEQPTWPQVERMGDLVEGDPSAYWQSLADEARGLVEGADLDLEMDTPMGRRTVRDRLAFPAIDLFVHAWDIGHATGLDVAIPDDVVDFAHGYLDPIPDDKMRGEGGAFGPEVEPPSDATNSERFLAWTGRPSR